MADRETLLEILNKPIFPHEMVDPLEAVTDYLLDNDVVPVVRCKDCRHCDPENHHCDHPMGTTVPVPRKMADFCSYGERKTDV